jgi:hypothetical protein
MTAGLTSELHLHKRPESKLSRLIVQLQDSGSQFEPIQPSTG